MWPLLEGGSARLGVGWGGVFRPPSLSEGWGMVAPLGLDVFVGPRGKEEFHGGGVAVGRGVHERRT